jgi:hypothetical protein
MSDGIGGRYRATQAADGSWSILDVPVFGPLPAGARKVGQRLRSLNVTESTTRVDGKVVAAWAGVRQLAEYEPPADPTA